MPKNITVQTYDALVIGSGISGLVAARRLAETKGRSIAILGNGVGASPYVHGFNMPLHPEDSVELFLKDTLESGRGQCDVSLATTLCSKAPELIPVLKELGIEFDPRKTEATPCSVLWVPAFPALQAQATIRALPL